MLYRGNDVIKNIEWVIFDEIHYINNEERGVVWEETIIMLPDHIGIVMLSATVQNVMDFAEWVGRIRQRKIYVQRTDYRPVPLEHYVYFKELVLIKPKSGTFLQSEYDGFVKGLKQQKRDHAKFKEEKKQELYNKKQAFAEMGNQKERLKKMTAKGQGGKMNLDYLLKKQVDRANGENTKSGGLPEVEDIKTLVNRLKSENLLPAIFFAFSKKRLTQIVNELERHVSLITPQERAEIEAFYYTAIKRLKKKDQSIYQLTWLKDIMLKGIGIHHGDLLPLGKEIVEILLQRNLIKLLFATDSFAMGLNMPTKTVVFNGLRKHDGTEFRDLLGSEYTQMSGRAGRRGLDEKGMVISFFHQEKDLPKSQIIGNMVTSKGESLKSKFKMSYSILFNSLSSQSIELDDIMKKSFGEDSNYTELKNLKTRREDTTVELENTKIKCEFVDIEDTIPIFGYKEKADELYELSGRFYSREMLIKNFGFPKFARIIDDQTYQYLDVLLFDFVKDQQRKGFITFYSGVVFRKASPENLKSIWLNGIEFRAQPSSSGKSGMQYYKFNVDVPPSNIFGFYNNRTDRIDHRTPDSEIILEFAAFEKALTQGKAKYQESAFQGSYAQDWAMLCSLRDSIVDSKCYVCELKPKHINNITKSKEVQTKLDNIEKAIKDSEVVYGFKETEQMRNVLRDLNFVNSSFIPQIKARVARELGGGDETLYLTELLMNNVFDKLEPEEIVAVVSVFVAQAKSKEETDIESLEIPQTLVDALIKCEEIFKWINEAEKKNGLVEEEEEMKQPQANFLLVKPLYEWARGKDFVEISEFTEVLEGAIVRTIQRVEQTLRNIKKALTVLGNDTQVQKVEKASATIKRDIAFALSLYIDENKEILE